MAQKPDTSLSFRSSHNFKVYITESEYRGHPRSFSMLVLLQPQTVSYVHSWELLNSSHSFLLLAMEGLCRQTWHLCKRFCGLTIIKTAFVIASVVVARIVKSPPCTIKRSDVILWETGLQLLVSPTKNEAEKPNAKVDHLFWLKTSIDSPLLTKAFLHCWTTF